MFATRSELFLACECNVCWCVLILAAGGAYIELVPYRYLFQVDAGQYCLGMFDNGYQGTLLGGILTRNVLVQVVLVSRLCLVRLHQRCTTQCLLRLVLDHASLQCSMLCSAAKRDDAAAITCHYVKTL